MSAGTYTRVVGRVRGALTSDEGLLTRTRQGDAASFEEFYRRNKEAVFGYCLLRLKDRQAAEDSAQEVFLRAHEGASGSIANARAWMFAIARNVVVDAVRRRQSAPDLLGLEPALNTAASVADETAFAALDVTGDIFIALRRLPSRYQRALILREFHDKASQQIADELGMKPGAVDVLLCRARAAFGRAYAEVADMPSTCRQATELIYRESGSGISDRQRQLMQAHVAACPRCTSEHTRAHAGLFAGGLLAWLGLRLDALGATEWAYGLRSAGHQALVTVDGMLPVGWAGPAKAVVVAAVAMTVVTPGVVSRFEETPNPSNSLTSEYSLQPISERAEHEAREKVVGEGGLSAGAAGAYGTHEAGHLDAEPHPKSVTEPGHDVSGTETHASGSQARASESGHAGSATSVEPAHVDATAGTHTGTTESHTEPAPDHQESAPE